MGWYLDKTLLRHLWSRRLLLLRKVRYLLTNMRHLSHLDVTPHRSFLRTYSPPQSSKRKLFKSHRSKNFSITKLNLQMFRFYSNSSRETFKAEAPIGVLQNRRSSLRLLLLRLRLGESFTRLSTHVNLYFKQKEVFVSEEPFTRTQRRALRGRSLGDTRSFIGSPVLQEASLNLSQEPPLTQSFAVPQLFHISTLATRFGESYSYVANHINSVFSRSPAEEIDASRRSRKRPGDILGNKNGPRQKNEQEVHSNNESSSWEEGYLHFARHINRYFGAKVADGVEESPRQIQASQIEMIKSSQDLPARPKSLFHMSSLTTRFGENYTYMANHINRYFKGSAEDEEMDRGLPESTVTPETPVSFFERLLKPLTIPRFVVGYLGMGSSSLGDQITTESRILYKTVSFVCSVLSGNVFVMFLQMADYVCTRVND